MASDATKQLAESERKLPTRLVHLAFILFSVFVLDSF
jgi:hypothetical protein